MSPTNNPIIDLRQIQFRYPSTDQLVLSFESLQIKKGEKVFLFGPSGSGKTTLLELISGILSAQKGEVEVVGQKLHTMSQSERDRFRAQHLGYIFQNFNLIPYLNVVENILLPWDLHSSVRERLKSIYGNEDIHKMISELLRKLGLQGFENRPVTELSTGQQQRVAVARSLFQRPELLMADEPTSSLDYDHRENFIRLLFEQCEKDQTSLLFVSHDRSLMKLFDRVINLTELNQIPATGSSPEGRA